jgi:hypothetical protein
MLRKAGGKARNDDGGAPEAGEDGTEDDDGEEADGGGPSAWQAVRASADFGRPAAVENPVGQRTEGGGWGG